MCSSCESPYTPCLCTIFLFVPQLLKIYRWRRQSQSFFLPFCFPLTSSLTLTTPPFYLSLFHESDAQCVGNSSVIQFDEHRLNCNFTISKKQRKKKQQQQQPANKQSHSIEVYILIFQCNTMRIHINYAKTPHTHTHTHPQKNTNNNNNKTHFPDTLFSIYSIIHIHTLHMQSHSFTVGRDGEEKKNTRRCCSREWANVE